MRTIDADALSESIKRGPGTDLQKFFADVCVVAAPTVDAVIVTRCKDCKWFADNNDGEWYGCQMFQVVRITPEDAPKPDDFCSYGERKDGGNG